MRKTTIYLIAAARPNFMKIAPLYHALNQEPWADPVIVHTGQHYDTDMSDTFFKDLALPAPHVHLGIGSGTHAEQTGRVMIAYEQQLLKTRPDLTVVVGDVNSTAAATMAAVKLGVPVAHLEAGLRSFDRSMPEEINRVVTDAIADILWTPSPDADENLAREGVDRERIERVGNIMIDSLEMLRPAIEKEDPGDSMGAERGSFGVVTLHRPANVDRLDTLKPICESLVRIAAKMPLVFPVHPRTRKNLTSFGLLEVLEQTPGMHLTGPLSYIRFMHMVFNCRMAITDSGGIQEETTYLGIPCLTLRPNTERPITVTQGTNRLCKAVELEDHVDEILKGGGAGAVKPDLWDGHTAQRVAASIRRRVG